MADERLDERARERRRGLLAADDLDGRSLADLLAAGKVELVTRLVAAADA